MMFECGKIMSRTFFGSFGKSTELIKCNGACIRLLPSIIFILNSYQFYSSIFQYYLSVSQIDDISVIYVTAHTCTMFGR